MTLRLSRLLIPGQGVVALAMLALWPPPSGRLMLLSLAGDDRNGLALMALAGNARLVGAGPLPGSIVVVGERSAMLKRGGWSVLVSAALPAGCTGGEESPSA